MLKGLGGLGDMAKMMKQATEMQEKFAALQDAGVKTVRSLADIGKALAELTGWEVKKA